MVEEISKEDIITNSKYYWVSFELKNTFGCKINGVPHWDGKYDRYVHGDTVNINFEGKFTLVNYTVTEMETNWVSYPIYIQDKTKNKKSKSR